MRILVKIVHIVLEKIKNIKVYDSAINDDDRQWTDFDKNYNSLMPFAQVIANDEAEI